MIAKDTPSLRKVLLESIDGVQTKTIEPQDAHALCNLAGKVIASKRLDLETAKFIAIAPKNRKLVENGVPLT